MNIVDIIAILLVILFIVWGAKRGFVRSVFSLSSVVLSLILALTLYPVVSNFMEESVVGDYVRLNVYKVFDTEKEEIETKEEASEKLNLPANLTQTISDTADEAIDNVKTSVAESTASLALKLLALIAVFLLIRIILWLAEKLLHLIVHLPVLKTANKL